MNARLARPAIWLAAFAVTATILAPSALAASPKRTWTAVVASRGATGTAVAVVNTDFSGTVTIRLSGLQRRATYSAMIYIGTCARPASLVVLPTFAGSASGGAARSFRLNRSQANALFNGGTRNPIAFRFARGGVAHCAALSFPRASRVAIGGLGIDLPIVLQKDGYPLCNVAMYHLALSQPGELGPTFIYAHARTGMFLPLLTQSKVRNGASMVGMTVRVWRSDNKLMTYRITRVLRRQYVLPRFGPNVEKLWLQTSEGPSGTPNKLIIEARRISTEDASSSASNPTPRPLRCG